MDSLILLKCIGEIEDRYILSAQKRLFSETKRLAKVVPVKKYMVLAAVIVLALALVGCAIIFGLRYMKIGEYTNTLKPEYSTAPEQAQPEDMISLQGFVDSRGYKAAREWLEFLENYDPDGVLLAKADTDDYKEKMEHMAYLCYSQEMEDKINEICSKYGLNILGPTYTAEHAWQIFDAVGIRTITFDQAAAVVQFDPGYFYRDGSFFLSGAVSITDENSPWIFPVIFQYRCVQKNSFDSVSLTVGDIESYDEWSYILPDGGEVLLALSEEKALIIADRENFFATVNILNPYYGEDSGVLKYMDRAALESIADTFTFNYEPSEPLPDMLIEPEWYN